MRGICTSISTSAYGAAPARAMASGRRRPARPAGRRCAAALRITSWLTSLSSTSSTRARSRTGGRARPRRAAPGSSSGAVSATPSKPALNQNCCRGRGSLSRRPRRPSSRRSRWRDRQPRPVPPKRRVVEVSACTKAENSCGRLLRRDADAGVAHAKRSMRGDRRPAAADSARPAAVGELHALLSRLSSACDSRGRVAAQQVGQHRVGGTSEQLQALAARGRQSSARCARSSRRAKRSRCSAELARPRPWTGRGCR